MNDDTTRRRFRALWLVFVLVASVLVVPLGPVEEAAAAGNTSTIVVDADGDGDYRKIQDAVDNASSGDTIQIEPGNYNETLDSDVGPEAQVVIDKPNLTIRGDPSDSTRGAGPDAPKLNTDDGSTFELTNNSSGTRITGIDGSEVTVSAEIEQVDADGNAVGTELTDIEVTQSNLARVWFGIDADDGESSAYRNIEISGNVFEEPTFDNPSVEIGDEDSRHLFEYENITVSNNEMPKKVVIGNSWETNYRNISVSDNRMGALTLSFLGDNDNALYDYGNDPSTADDVTVARNDIVNAEDDDGIYLRFGGTYNPSYEDVSVNNNTIDSGSNNVHNGILMEVNNSAGAVYDVDILDNEINESSFEGIYVETTGDDGTANEPSVLTNISRNEIRDGDRSAIRFAKAIRVEHGLAAPFEISRNVFEGNAYGITNNVTGQDVDARNNYWGAADGPSSRSDGPLEDPETDTVADGSGQSVSENASDSGVSNVRFDPFLTAPPDSTGEPSFSVSIDSTNSPVTEGETLDVEATVENTGDETGTQTVSLSTDGDERDSTEVTLDSGGSTSVTLHWNTGHGDAGAYTASVGTDDDTASDSVTVDSPTPANFSMANLTVSDTDVVTDEEFDVTAEITNTGDESGTQEVDLVYNFSAIANKSVTLDSGESTTEAFENVSVAPDHGMDSQTAFLEVVTDNDSAMTTVTVEAADDGDSSDDESTTGGGSGGVGGSAGGGSPPSDDAPERVVEELTDEIPDEPGVQVPVAEGPVEELSFEDDEIEGEGEVAVEELDEPPTSVSAEFDTQDVITATEIDVPDEAADSSAEITFRVSESELGDRDPDTLQVVRVVDGENQRVPTEVTEESGGVTVEADTPGFSAFAVVSVQADRGPTDEETGTTTTAEPTPAPTTADEPDPAPTATSTQTQAPGGQPGFGLLVGVVALTMAGLLALRPE